VFAARPVLKSQKPGGRPNVMRIHISHSITYRYAAPPSSVTQMLRLTPRNHDGQYVVGWRIDLSQECTLHQQEDAFGNLTHSFTADGPFDALSIAVDGEMDTHDTNGVVTGTVERFPPALFLRETTLTEPDPALAALADSARGGNDTVSLLHKLMQRMQQEVAYDPDPARMPTTAAEALKKRSGTGQDLSHVYIAAARLLGVPARYVGGHVCRPNGSAARQSVHAWAEAYVEGLGWVGFDPAHDTCPTDAYVRVATGLDYLNAAPVRGTRFGGSGETLTVAVQVAQARLQSQN
jgi:transglutaminase-like putative cysteine protease